MASSHLCRAGVMCVHLVKQTYVYVHVCQGQRTTLGLVLGFPATTAFLSLSPPPPARLSHQPGTCQVDTANWPASLQDLTVTPSSAEGLQLCATPPGFSPHPRGRANSRNGSCGPASILWAGATRRAWWSHCRRLVNWPLLQGKNEPIEGTLHREGHRASQAPAARVTLSVPSFIHR